MTGIGKCLPETKPICWLLLLRQNVFCRLRKRIATQSRVRTALLCKLMCLLPSVDKAQHILESLRDDSATGPDNLPTHVLKTCARLLAAPLQKLAMRILAEGRWPENWIQHWIAPLYKRKEVFKAGNYRGVHLTSQVSKAMERLLVPLFVPYLSTSGNFGSNHCIPERQRS